MITRQKVTVVPITDTIISKIEQQAANDGIKSLKFYNRKKQQLFGDTDLIAGVDEETNNETDTNIIETDTNINEEKDNKEQEIEEMLEEEDQGIHPPTNEDEDEDEEQEQEEQEEQDAVSKKINDKGLKSKIISCQIIYI